MLDAVLQADGRLLGVGFAGQGLGDGTLSVVRLNPDGMPDSSFGDDGRRDYGDGTATSVATDSGGRLVVAGIRDGQLLVLRLAQSGEPDASFADAGSFIGPAVAGRQPRVLRVGKRGYRVLVHEGSSTAPTCRVIALTADGRLDESFGALGYADIALAPYASNSCSSILRKRDGSLLVAGANGDRAFVVQLTANGEPDSSFEANAIPASMWGASAMATGPDDSVVLAGRGAAGLAGAVVARLRADGSPDAQFGNEGITWVDVPGGGSAGASDVAVLPGGDIVVAGGASIGWYGKPYVARLSGSDLVASPGVIGLSRPNFELAQDVAQVVMTVRRMGGKTGAVSVSYATKAAEEAEFPATETEDYTPVAGRLEWTDGDATEKEVVIPLGPDLSTPEERDVFEFVVSDVSGGAGLGTDTASVAIQPDGAPFGQFAITRWGTDAAESDGYVQMEVQRNYYWAGAVSVNLVPVSGTARAGEDFPTDPVTVSWPDSESGTAYVNVPINDDDEIEGDETFTIELSGATGGAVIGPRSSMTITIKDDDPSSEPEPPPPDPTESSGGGGGRLDWLALLLLVAGAVARSIARELRPTNRA